MKRRYTVERWTRARGWCLWCGADFAGEHSQRKFCGGECRRLYYEDLDGLEPELGVELCNAAGGEA